MGEVFGVGADVLMAGSAGQRINAGMSYLCLDDDGETAKKKGKRRPPPAVDCLRESFEEMIDALKVATEVLKYEERRSGGNHPGPRLFQEVPEGERCEAITTNGGRCGNRGVAWLCFPDMRKLCHLHLTYTEEYKKAYADRFAPVPPDAEKVGRFWWGEANF